MSRMFTTCVNAVYHRVKADEIWPSCEQALATLPEKERQFCPTLTCILDATEIYIEQSKNPEA